MDKILLIEDDRSIHKALRLLFEPEGFAVEIASDGRAGIDAFRTSKPELVILDLTMPEMNGKDVCREIRKLSPTQPIIILSAASDEINKVVLLELGADDYLTKPFSPKELLARVRALLRRARQPAKDTLEHYSFDDVTVDFAKMELRRGDRLVPLTPQEFKILRYLFQNPERVIPRDELLNEVWGYQCYPTTRTVDNHILKLRQKLEKDPANPLHFRTVHGAGYKFVP
jgi:DNA-binding response OmpR family regulator